MATLSPPCTHFDTPEGKWVLVSEFLTEDAANQFLPNVAKDIGADDLCAGASNSSTMGTVPPTTSIGSTTGGMRFGAASTAMAAGGLMFPTTPMTQQPQQPSSTALASSQQQANAAILAANGGQQRPYMHTLANRPTNVTIFQSAAGLEAGARQQQVGNRVVEPAEEAVVGGGVQAVDSHSIATKMTDGSGMSSTSASTTRLAAAQEGSKLTQGSRKNSFLRGWRGTSSTKDKNAVSVASPPENTANAQHNSSSSSNVQLAANNGQQPGEDGGKVHGPQRFGKGQSHGQQGKGIITKSTSSYVSRLVTTENLARWIMDDHAASVFLMFNAPRSMTWAGMRSDFGSETLARLDLAGSTPLCHAVNETTRSESRLDVVMGFVHGEVIWYEPVSGKYSRLNKHSGYSSAITCIQWLPGSDSLFMAGTADGALIIMDRTKDEFSVPALAHSSRRLDRMDQFEVAHSSRPKNNPVAFWRASNQQITALAFSPDGQRVAVTSEDGALRVIDYMNELLEDVYLSYFGGLSCVAWSHDARYLVTGGKDDLLTVWSHYEQTAVARCVGHESWVRDVKFDPRSPDGQGTYRFLSVGEDAKLLVWDFSLQALHRPRAQLHRTPSHQPARTQHARSGSTVGASHLSGRAGVDDEPSEIVHPRVPRDACAVLQPLMAEKIHDASLCALQFSQDLLVTACRQGVVKVWKRPAPVDDMTGYSI